MFAITSRSLRRRVRLFVALAASLLSLGAFAAPGLAADSHGYPRTFHIYGGWSNADELARYDMVVGYESNWNIATLRSMNPTGIYLLNPGLNPGSADYRGVSITYGAVDQWKGGTCPSPVGYVPPFDPAVDYLRRPNGDIALVNAAYGHPGFNVARPQTAEKVAKIFACAALIDGVMSKGWDGVWSDNWVHTIGASWFYGPLLDTDLDGLTDDPIQLRRRWDDGLALIGSRLRSYLPGKTVGGNGVWYGSETHRGTDPESWLGEANVTMMEYLSSYYDNPAKYVTPARQWLAHADPGGRNRYLAVQLPALTATGSKFEPTGDVNSPANMLEPSVMRSMRWGLTLSLMTGAYFEINPEQRHDARWWYDEYDGGPDIRARGYLGARLAAPVTYPNGVWRRDFANGIALNNSKSRPRTIRLESPYRHIRGVQNPTLNDGSVVRIVTIPPHDGVILLRTTAAQLPVDLEAAGSASSVRIVGARALQNRRIGVRLRVSEDARVTIAVRGPQGRLLAKKVLGTNEAGLFRYRIRLLGWRGQRQLAILVKSSAAGHTSERRARLRLTTRGVRQLTSS